MYCVLIVPFLDLDCQINHLQKHNGNGRIIRHLDCSLRSKHSARFRSKERGTRVKHRAKNGVSKSFILWRSFHFSRCQSRESRLPRSSSKTLATQAISTVNHDPFSYIVRGNQINALNLKYSDNNPMLNYPLLGFCLSKYKTDFSTVNYDPFN